MFLTPDQETESRVLALRDAYRVSPSVAIKDIETELAAYKFYHNIEVAPGIMTKGHEWANVYQDNFREATKGINFIGKSVLDVGCRDGAMLFMAEERGALELIGVDNDASPGLTNFLIPFRSSKIRNVHANAYDLDELGIPDFDIVMSAGMIYHLAYPMWGIRKLLNRVKPGGILIIETAILDAFEDLPLILYTN